MSLNAKQTTEHFESMAISSYKVMIGLSYAYH